MSPFPFTFNPHVGTPLLTTDTLTVTFAQAMNTSSAVTAITPAGGTWNAGNTTYTFPALVAGTLNVAISAVSASGVQQYNVNNIVFNVYDPGLAPFVHVSPAGNDITGTGSASAPFATIARGIASAVYGQAVLVAAGTYNVDSGAAAPTNVVLKDGVSLYGGYSANFSSRNPVANVTTITDIASAPAATAIKTDFGTNSLTCGAAAAGTPMAPISVGALTTTVIVDGFTVNGSAHASTVDSAAVSLNSAGGTLVVTDSTLNGGAGSAVSAGIYAPSGGYAVGAAVVNGGSSTGISMGVYTGSGSINAIFSTINGGSGATSAGVFNDDLGNISANLYNSTITGGSGRATYGIFSVPNCPALTQVVLVSNGIGGGGGTASSTAYAADNWVNADIFNNTLDGGSGAVSTGIALASGGTANVYNNSISGGNGTTSSTAIVNSTGSTADIEDSILFVTSGAGAQVCYNNMDGFAASGTTETFNNNDVSPSCATALYSYAGTGVTSLAAMTTNNAASSTLAASGVISVNPAFVSASNWHLTSGTPAEVQQGGVNRIGVKGAYSNPTSVPEPSANKDGAVRTPSLSLTPANAGAAGISMGAF